MERCEEMYEGSSVMWDVDVVPLIEGDDIRFQRWSLWTGRPGPCVAFEWDNEWRIREGCAQHARSNGKDPEPSHLFASASHGLGCNCLIFHDGRWKKRQLCCW